MGETLNSSMFNAFLGTNLAEVFEGFSNLRVLFDTSGCFRGRRVTRVYLTIPDGKQSLNVLKIGI